MRMIGWVGAWLGVLVLAASTAGAAEPAGKKAPTFQEQQAKGLAENPPDVIFKVSLKDGKNQFRPGEIIRIEMQFSSTSPKKYLLDGGLYDRGGRMDTEKYIVDPKDGTVDPLADYFEYGGGWFGGMRQMPILEEKPYSIVQEINEWVRFDRPGKYRLIVKSSRLQSDPQPGDKSGQTQWHRLTSAILDIEILPPDPAWAKEELAKAIKECDEKKDDAVRAGQRALRFLGTEDAAREMVKRFAAADGYAGQLKFGLIGSPHRALAVREMEAMLDRGDQPISLEFMRTLTLMVLKLRNPDMHYSTGNAAADNAARQTYADARRKVEDEYTLRLAKSLDKREGRARAVTLDTLRGQLDMSDAAKNPDLAKLVPVVRAELVKSFADLPPGEQADVLENRWTDVDTPAMLPGLIKVYDGLPRQENENRGLRAAALRRLYQLSHEEGRKRILAELALPTTDVDRFMLPALVMLPDATLPQFDKAWADVLDPSNHSGWKEIAASLLARYGSATVLPQVRKAYDDKETRSDRSVQTPLLAYLLRVDEPYGLARLREAVGHRDGTPDNNPTCLNDVARLYVCPAMEKVAVETLDDTSPRAVAAAALFLQNHGSPAAKPMLLNRLELWTATWKDRRDALAQHVIGDNTNWEERNLEQALVQSLAEADGWVLSHEESAHVAALCLTGQTYLLPEGGKVSMVLWHMGSGEFNCWVGNFRDIKSVDGMKRKMAQYPKGTVFTISPSPPEPSDWAKIAVDLKTFAESKGMTVDVGSKP